MPETMLGLDANTVLGTIGTLAAANTIVVEVLKAVLPKKIPTKVVAIICAIIIAVGYVFIFGVPTVKTTILAIFGGFVIAFISMFGFDSLKEIFDRFKIKDKGGEK